VAAAGSKCQFQNEVVVGIRQERAPEEVDFLQVGLAGKEAQESARVFRCAAGREVFRAGQSVPATRCKDRRKGKAGIRARGSN
jgi:hypothetical protein